MPVCAARCTGRDKWPSWAWAPSWPLPQGSAEELRFVVLRYNGAGKNEAPVVLVGKGITFDTGGISIKPAPEMDEMKFDMCGAASVLGVFRALAELKPAINVVGLIPTCENMPDGKAVKPGDVVTSMSGQTIEILNTDAEGRLILCDALTYAERFKPCAVVDIATLTGACVIALGGSQRLFASRRRWPNPLQAAGERTQDLCWRMPLDDDYAEGLKSHFADMANVAGRAGGSITAAKFLQKVCGQVPMGAPGHCRHGLEERRGQGGHRSPCGLALLPAATCCSTWGTACPRLGANMPRWWRWSAPTMNTTSNWHASVGDVTANAGTSP
jgi:hypothetical protein